ncbi:alpha-1,2-fucosyltransferase [Cryobacterium suzukii]|uniref:Alpha-1,2-fucosyltransferase n=1 Tax=Cryobacterium suzukii TaxID=1259198 RepID=A0A4R9AFV2_9MICO|nr:alpha-1,2-fucosyltransferase [Cryobacterium suzukii]TFD61351.1 alpha-1,2-fucosyltransferase [Cryobacterium suzukii]
MATVVDIRDGICAYLQGGLGNQLFILAAGLEQANRLGCPLYIDASRFLGRDPLEFARETPWPYAMDSLNLPGTIIGTQSPWYKNSPRRPRAIRQPGRRSFGLSVYRQPAFGYDEKINDISRGTTILGYFQSPKFFENVAEQVHDIIWKSQTSETESLALQRVEDDPRISVHMRRGDYLSTAARAHHGIASAEYFVRALDLCAKLVPATGSRIFSDSPEVAREEIGNRTGVELFLDADTLGTVATLKAMAMGTGFVMSNSSFSWWAAWLMMAAGERPVIAPRPWKVSGESASDLLLPGWLTLDAR